MGKVVALSGGVGAAKLLRGLVKVVPPENLFIIGNVGDDIELYGLQISPDLEHNNVHACGDSGRRKRLGDSRRHPQLP
ncbi:MAG: 2-phospho-L-lactate transferase CofD family protein [Candidatus Bathyarchaeia archaeon]